jgi:hypothetical protein
MVLPVTGTISASQIMSEYNLTTLQYPPDRMTGNLCSFSSTGINYLTNGTYTTSASSNSTVAYNAFNSTSITTSLIVHLELIQKIRRIFHLLLLILTIVKLFNYYLY